MRKAVSADLAPIKQVFLSNANVANAANANAANAGHHAWDTTRDTTRDGGDHGGPRGGPRGTTEGDGGGRKAVHSLLPLRSARTPTGQACLGNKTYENKNIEMKL